ncbi:MAG: HDIG domain-containing protein [Dysgonamonadaceae bacterium]|jgi:putative nucleotidyltransferase with HDIG domain|nr:HDIG domain-containing protein [Dysgonamonadaceae bacterium]
MKLKIPIYTSFIASILVIIFLFPKDGKFPHYIKSSEFLTVLWQFGIIGGISLLVGGLVICFFLHFFYLQKQIFAQKKDVFFSLLLLTFFVVLTEIAISYEFFNVYIIPYTIIPIVIRNFFDSRTAQTTYTITILICSLMVQSPLEFIILQTFACMVTIYALQDLTQRRQLIACSFYILLTYILIYFGLLLFQGNVFSNWDWSMLIYFGINFLLVMCAYPFIYILEKAFGYISNVTLIELSDINLPVLQQLSEKAPGTFQHSLQVSMLGTAAAVKVGANPQLIRTGALYHDIGKMENPLYFVENRLAGRNPHDELSLVESARIITRHVPDGVKIAEKHSIPSVIIQFIKTHHGKGKAKYFYNSFINQFPNEPVDESAFTYYSGENPDTKETAILMMADSVEAASRSLTDYSENSFRTLIDKIVDGQIADGLMENAPLTFKHIKEIKQVFLKRLLSVYHSRITYPEIVK